jgi:hypothetical protein
MEKQSLVFVDSGNGKEFQLLLIEERWVSLQKRGEET